MIKEDILKHLELSDLPENFRIVAEVCGMDVAKALINELGGIYINIPQITSMKNLIRKYCNTVAQTHPQKTKQQLAKEIGLNERTIQKIIKSL